MTVWGWISDVHAHEASARHQRFYINGRPVTHRRLLHALYDAYKGRLFVGRHPAAALFLEIDPSLVDVNVHPAKREVRLSNEGEVHDFLSRALQDALSESAAMPAALADGVLDGRRPEIPPPFIPSSRPSWAESKAAYRVQEPLPAHQPSFAAAEPAREEGAPLPLETFRGARFEALTQFDNTYILARSEERLYIFDQHAAAERALYERLTDAAEGKNPSRQALLLPWVWEASPEVAAVIRDHLPDLTRLGYELEPFGPKAYRVKGVPGLLGDSSRVKELLEGLVDDLLSEKIGGQWDALVTRAACRGSVRAGDSLQAPHMQAVIKDLQGCRSPWSCPHGRPTFLRLEPGELARRFKRV
jgi:DNA mismatch repair protein MutL